MKKFTFVTLILIIALGISVSAFRFVEKAQAVSVQINIKDIPEYGLTIDGPQDSAFEKRLATIASDQSKSSLMEAMKPFSVFLNNKGNKAIVAYWLKWEIMTVDGAIITKQIGGVNPGALMDGDQPGAEQLSVTEGQAIKPQSARFVSPMLSLREGSGGTIGSYTSDSANQDVIAALRRSEQNQDIAALAKAMTAELRNYKSMTVSLDGVFFEDGTFVGPNTTQFLEKVRAIRDAKFDLVEEIFGSLVFCVKHHNI